MLYYAGNGQELLSAIGVTLVCHASNVPRVLRVPLSIIDAFSKSMAWLLVRNTLEGWHTIVLLDITALESFPLSFSKS